MEVCQLHVSALVYQSFHGANKPDDDDDDDGDEDTGDNNDDDADDDDNDGDEDLFFSFAVKLFTFFLIFTLLQPDRI